MSGRGEAIWLVTGASGQVGGALADGPPPGVRIVAPGRDVLDLADAALDVAPLIGRERITAIINCGAFTQVDRAETEPDIAMRVNGDAPGILARAAAAAGIPLVQVSTDYVFSGTGDGWYRETDLPGPATVYGRSKLAGEQAVMRSGARHAVVRTSWVFGASGHNFLTTMLRLGRERAEIAVVDDQWGCPTHSGDLAAALATITAALADDAASSGIWHIANAGATSWAGFAGRIFETARRHGWHVPQIRAIPSSAYPTPAPRPANSKLSTANAAANFGLRLRPWEEASDEVVGAICSGEGT